MVRAWAWPARSRPGSTWSRLGGLSGSARSLGRCSWPPRTRTRTRTPEPCGRPAEPHGAPGRESRARAALLLLPRVLLDLSPRTQVCSDLKRDSYPPGSGGCWVGAHAPLDGGFVSSRRGLAQPGSGCHALAVAGKLLGGGPPVPRPRWRLLEASEFSKIPALASASPEEGGNLRVPCAGREGILTRALGGQTPRAGERVPHPVPLSCSGEPRDLDNDPWPARGSSGSGGQPGVRGAGQAEQGGPPASSPGG